MSIPTQELIEQLDKIIKDIEDLNNLIPQLNLEHFIQKQ